MGFLQAVFGASSFDQLDTSAAEATVGTRGDQLSEKIANVLRQVRAERPVPFMQLHVTRNGEPKEGRFLTSLIEDRTIGNQSTYTEFLQRMGYRPQSGAPPQQQQPQPGQPGMGQPGMGQPPMGQPPPMGQQPPMMGQQPPMGQPPMGQPPMGMTQPPMMGMAHR